jgi:penicillin-insensitive murein endopeptidase
VSLPFEGAGYRVHPDWQVRRRTFATPEVVGWLTRAFARVAQDVPESLAHVGDLSGRGGGNSALHRSHESGRDVDIFYFALDEDGRPLRDLPAMLRFGADGRVTGWSPSRHGQHIERPLPAGRFDMRRNWALVRALLSDPGVEVQWIFMHRPLASLLFQQAELEKSDPALLARARAVVHQPGDSQAHDDHMHVRVYCAPESRAFGCIDKGPQRWLKKRWKYLSAGRAVLPGAGNSS